MNKLIAVLLLALSTSAFASFDCESVVYAAPKVQEVRRLFVKTQKKEMTREQFNTLLSNHSTDDESERHMRAAAAVAFKFSTKVSDKALVQQAAKACYVANVEEAVDDLRDAIEEARQIIEQVQ